MSDQRLHLIDVTDVLRHFLATRELGGIPRLLVTIIEESHWRDDIRFCIFSSQEERFLTIGNRRSIDVALLDQHDFPRNVDNIALWTERAAPDLRPVDAILGDRQAHYYFLSSQWDSLCDRNDTTFIERFVAKEQVTALHHDSYLLESDTESARARRFFHYWSTIKNSGSQIFHISEHSKRLFEKFFGLYNTGNIAHYDFAFSYPRTERGVSRDAINLANSAKPYLLVFSVIDGRKSPLPLIRSLVTANADQRHEIALIVRFANESGDERIQLIDLVLTHRLKAFFSPNDSTYLWLIRYAHAIFYPSIHEGYGLVPLDCKQFGKPCYIPAGADYAYLHDNVVTYDLDHLDVDLLPRPNFRSNELLSFSSSSFARMLLAPDLERNGRANTPDLNGDRSRLGAGPARPPER